MKIFLERAENVNMSDDLFAEFKKDYEAEVEKNMMYWYSVPIDKNDDIRGILHGNTHRIGDRQDYAIVTLHNEYRERVGYIKVPEWDGSND